MEFVTKGQADKGRQSGPDKPLVHSLYIINKSGGLIYQKNFVEGVSIAEDPVRLGGLLYGMHTFTSKLSPVPDCTGLEVLETDTFRLHCFQTLTGTKFFMTADAKRTNVDKVLQSIYVLYTDYVLKNPFYEFKREQPIRCAKFDYHLDELIRTQNA
ncbi:Trafficking protein particle complex subunit [Balamuthia mandrillaris]